MYRQYHVTCCRLDVQHIDRSAHFCESDTGVPDGHQTSCCRGKLFDLETVIRILPGSRSEKLDGVAGIANLLTGSGGDQVDVASLNVSLSIITGFQN